MAFEPPGGKIEFADPANLGECWITSTTTPELTTLNTQLGATTFEAYAVAACAMVNRLTKRYFNRQQADEQFMNKQLGVGTYTTFSLRNLPLETLDTVWEEVISTFTEVSTTNFQVDKRLGIVKALSSVITTSIPSFRSHAESTNVWIRYTSGYTTANVPAPIKIATAQIMEWMVTSGEADALVLEMRTQTYMEKIGSGSNSPKLRSAITLLRPYTLMRAF